MTLPLVIVGACVGYGLGRLGTFFRTMLPRLVEMPFRRFLVASAVGAVIWGSVLVMAGYLVGQSFTAIARRVDSIR